MEDLSVYSSLVLSLIGVIFVVFLAYFVTKWITKKYKSMGGGRHIKVLERMPMGQNKSLVLTQVGEKVILLGVTNQSIGAICEMEAGELPVVESQSGPDDFYTIFTDLIKKQAPKVEKTFKNLRAPGRKK